MLDPRVSRQHVEVSFDGSSVTVRDLGSRNGTWVDGASVRTAELAGEASLAIGDTVFVVDRSSAERSDVV
jgi:pSer/pThr/pTyr-binding forkhead associated (FHA) protein